MIKTDIIREDHPRYMVTSRTRHFAVHKQSSYADANYFGKNGSNSSCHEGWLGFVCISAPLKNRSKKI